MVVLHIAKALPSQINLAANSDGSSSSSSGAGTSPAPYQVVLGGFSSGDADAASTLVASPGLLSKLRRNLYFG